MKFLFKFLKFLKRVISSRRGVFTLYGFSLLLIIFFFLYIFDFIILYSIFNLIYELFINISVFFSSYFFSALKYSIMYIFIYFLFCLFNISYLGYKRFKFFGFNLDDYKLVWLKYYYYLKDFNYFIFILFHFCLLNFLMYFIYANIIIFLLIFCFYIIILFSIKAKLEWDKLDKNYKTKIFNMSLNLIVIMILGYYWNLIIEYLTYFTVFKINGSDYFWKVCQDKFIIQFNNNKSVSKWFSFYGLKKDYFIKSFFFNFKKLNNDKYLLEGWNNNYIFNNSYKIFNKDYNKNIFNIYNVNNDDIVELKNNLKLEEFKFFNIKNFENNIICNNFNNFLLNNETDIKEIEGKAFNKFYDKFTYQNFLNNRINFIINNNLEKKNIFPIEKRNISFKVLLKRDSLNYNYLLYTDYYQDFVKNQIFEYDNYIEACKKKNVLYNNLYDLFLLKNNFKVLHFFRSNEFFYKNLIEEVAIHKFKIQLLTLFDSESFIYKIIINKWNNLKYDLSLIWNEKFNISLKKNLIKNIYNLDKYSFRNSLKNIEFRYKKYNLYNSYINKVKKNFIYIDHYNFIDFIELYFTHSAKQKFFKQVILKESGYYFFQKNVNKKEDIVNPLREFLEDIIYSKQKFYNVKLIKEEIEEFALKKYSLHLNLTFKEIDDLFNTYFFIESDNIYQYNTKNNKLNKISLKEYQDKLFNIKLYDELSNNKEKIVQEEYFKELKNRYNVYKKFVQKFFPNKSKKKYTFLHSLKYKFLHKVNLFQESLCRTTMLDKFFLFDKYNDKYILVKDNFKDLLFYKYDFYFFQNKIFIQTIREMRLNFLVENKDNKMFYDYLFDRTVNTLKEPESILDFKSIVDSYLEPWRSSLRNNKIIEWKMLEYNKCYDEIYKKYFNKDEIARLQELILNRKLNKLITNKESLLYKYINYTYVNKLFYKNILLRNFDEMEGHLTKFYTKVFNYVDKWEIIKGQKFNKFNVDDVLQVFESAKIFQSNLKLNSIIKYSSQILEMNRQLLYDKSLIIKQSEDLKYLEDISIYLLSLKGKIKILEDLDENFYPGFFYNIIDEFKKVDNEHDNIADRLFLYYKISMSDEDALLAQALEESDILLDTYKQMYEILNSDDPFDVSQITEQMEIQFATSADIHVRYGFDSYNELLHLKNEYNKLVLKLEQHIIFQDYYKGCLRDLENIYDKLYKEALYDYLQDKKVAYNCKIVEIDDFLRDYYNSLEIFKDSYLKEMKSLNQINSYLFDFEYDNKRGIEKEKKLKMELAKNLKNQKLESLLLNKDWDKYKLQRNSEEFKMFNIFNNKFKKDFVFINKKKKW